MRTPRASLLAFIIFASLVLPPLAAAQAGAPASEIETELAAIVAELRGDDAGVGALFARYDGVSAAVHVAGDVRADDHLRLASVSKVFLSFMFLREGLSPDAPIEAFHPGDRFPESDVITARMLLNHTSGVPDEMGRRIRDLGPGIDPAEALRALQPFLASPVPDPDTRTREIYNHETGLDFAPGEMWCYSNNGYLILGRILERATGQPVERLLTRHFGEVAPSLYLDDGRAARFPDSYFDPWPIHWSHPWVAGGLVARAEDALAAFHHVSEQPEFATMQQWTEAPRCPVDVVFGDAYGLGLQRYDLDGIGEAVGHDGHITARTILLRLGGASYLIHTTRPVTNLELRMLTQRLLATAGHASVSQTPTMAQAQATDHGAEAGLELAGFEDYRTPVGAVVDGVLRIRLEARPATWQPWGPDGPTVYTLAFSTDGEAPRVPAPLIRFAAGTPVHVTVRNHLADTLALRGLRDHLEGDLSLRAIIAGQLVIPPGAEAELRFTSMVPGTYSFGASRLPVSAEVATGLPGAAEADRTLRGVLIVDPPDSAPDPEERFFLITHWADPDLPASFLPATRFFINGRSWPHTERLTYAQGDTVRWRVINFSGRIHPMHLHGFYYHVDAVGDLFSEEVYAPRDRRLVVTEMLEPAQTMRMSWVAAEPGNWVFHCHFMRHMSWLQTAPFDGSPPSHHHDHDSEPREGEDLLGGLVLGITVLPGEDYAPAADVPRRTLDLFINHRAGFFGDEGAYSFVLGDGAARPVADSIRFPGSPIVLTRGEPTEIVVHNQSDVALGVHWHGLELESWADGVPGWSGMPGSVTPAIPPGGSLAVRMTPPRAGSFMYHVHSEPGHQLAQGLYGPFLVIGEGETWDPETDRVFVLGSLGGEDDSPAAVNGELAPGPVELAAGRTYRLRFLHISPDDSKRVTLLHGEGPIEWQHVAKDGADLPPNQARSLPADLRIHVGETYDFLWTPDAPGDFTLRVLTVFDQGVPQFPREAPSPHTQDIPVRVR
jgi:manganese oxidase